MGKFYLDIGVEVPAFLCERVGLDIDVSKVADDSREWVSQQTTLFVSRSALKQHTSTMVHFSLNINYIAQQVNMPLLRLLHQISSMYQNARETQIGLREQRPTLNKETNLQAHHKDGSYSAELHEADYKGAEYSISISEEQATVSSLTGIKGPRGSVVSSLSARISPPPTTSRTSRPQSFAQRLRSSTKMNKGRSSAKMEKGYTNLGAERGTGSPLFSISVSGSGLEGATICSSDKSPLLGPTEAPEPQTPVISKPKCWRTIYYLLDLYATTPETKTVQQRSSEQDSWYFKFCKRGCLQIHKATQNFEEKNKAMMNRQAVVGDKLGEVIKFVKKENNTIEAMDSRLRMVEAKSVDVKEVVDNNENLQRFGK
ncbi:hypothetical protein SK128_005102 [Halocaridina rubra]|uniref:Uncharacterized protein n=1 Tax=Halocaridina rubra TaxID=373956 RepID=A0AAN8ZSD1_HALRR